MADPPALPVCVAAQQVVHFIGMPEGLWGAGPGCAPSGRERFGTTSTITPGREETSCPSRPGRAAGAGPYPTGNRWLPLYPKA